MLRKSHDETRKSPTLLFLASSQTHTNGIYASSSQLGGHNGAILLKDKSRGQSEQAPFKDICKNKSWIGKGVYTYLGSGN